MAAPVYPTILTEADWDKNKGTIGKHSNELGIKAALDAVGTQWRQIDWNAALDCRPGHLKILARPLILHLLVRLQQAVPRLAATRTALVELGDVTRDVVGRYELTATYPKPTIDHVRKLRDAAVAFAAELEKNDLQREVLMLRKAKGYSRLCEHDLNQFLDDPRLSKLYLPWAKSSFCEQSWQFLMDTRCTTMGQLPPPEKVTRIYALVRDDDANIGVEKQKVLVALHEEGVLVTPPAGSEDRVRQAWEAAHKECQKMFPNRYRDWRNMLALDTNESLLLDPVLQA